MGVQRNRRNIPSKISIVFDNVNDSLHQYKYEYTKQQIDPCFCIFEPAYIGEQYFGFIEDWTTWQTGGIHWNDEFQIRHIVGIQEGLFGKYEFIFEEQKYKPSRCYCIKYDDDAISEWILKQTNGMGIGEINAFMDKFVSTKDILYREYNFLKDIFRHQFPFTERELTKFVHVTEIIKYFPMVLSINSWNPSVCCHLLTSVVDLNLKFHGEEEIYCLSYDVHNGFRIEVRIGKRQYVVMETHSVIDVVQYLRKLMREDKLKRTMQNTYTLR